MKMKTAQRQYQSTVTGPKIKMGFSADAATHLAELMSNSVYQDKYGSIVREVVSNAIDANVEAGSTQLVEVSVVRKPSLSDAVGYLSIRDFGPGITPDRIENIFTQYFASTKRDTNDQIGGFGIGAKSPFAYTPVFQVFTYIDGTRRHYLMEKGEAERTCSMIEEISTDQSNGTEIRVPIYDRQAEHKFIRAIGQQLILMGHMCSITVPDDVEFEMPTVTDYGDFLRINMPDDVPLEHMGLMVSLGNVLYKIDHPKSSNYTTTNYVVKLNIGDVSPTLSREGIEMNDTTRQFLIEKVQAIELTLQRWAREQSEPTICLEDLYGYRNSRHLKYPDGYEVKSFNQHKVEPMIADWPEDVDNQKFTSIVSQVLNLTTRYDWRGNRWRSANMGTPADIIKDKNYMFRGELIRKRPDQKLTAAWKDYMIETSAETEGFTVVFNVTGNMRTIVQDSLRYSLRDHDDESAQKAIDQALQTITVILNDWFNRKTKKYTDYTPTPEFLEARKLRAKSRRSQSKWTPDMLKQKVPVKLVNGNRYQRQEMSYEDLRKPKTVVVRYKHAKAINWAEGSKKGLKVYCVSDGNFKRVQKSGAQCWDQDKLQQVLDRQSMYIGLHALRSVFRTHHYLNRLGTVPAFEPPANPGCAPIDGVYNESIFRIRHDISYADGILRLDGMVYSIKKQEAQFRNLEKQLKKTPIGTLLYTALNHDHITDDLYRQAYNSLISQHG